ncbi:MAG: hypothetical protein AAGH64_00750 [Planctomycetota bacterium]
MSVAVVHVKPDLSEARLVDASGGAFWRAPAVALAEGQDALTASQWRERAQQAAQWMAGQRSVKRRLGALVVGVDDAVCLWVRSSSLAPPVLAASVARLTEEWGESASVWGVEPVYDAPRDPSVDPEHALSVVCHHQSLVRLLLDALDKRGVTPGVVVSDWHALALLAGERGGVTCVMSHDAVEHRLDWAWTDAEGLLAGGSVAVGDLEGEHAPGVASAAMQRCAMDWMTWSSQLGMSAERGVVVGPGAEALADAWRHAFPDRPIEPRETSGDAPPELDAIAKRLDGAGAGTGAEDDASSTRRCLGRLTQRPTRRTRKRYQFAALSCLLCAGAIGSIAVWMKNKEEAWGGRAEAARVEARELIESRYPGGIEGRPSSLVSVAANLYQREVAERSDVRLPPRPYPIFEEVARVTGLLVEIAEETFEDAPADLRDSWQIRVSRLNIEDSQARLSLMVPERQVATRVQVRLGEEGALMTWSNVTGSLPERPTFQGTWQR